jgi:hypothetical protein
LKQAPNTASPDRSDEPKEPVEPETPVQQEQAQVEPAEPTKQQDATDWAHKFSVLEGKYKAEVPRLAEEKRQLKAEIDELRRQIADLTTKKPEPKPKADLSALDAYFDENTRKVLDQYVEEQIESRLKDVRGEVQQTKAMSAKQQEQAFWREVMHDVPDYQSLVDDSELNTWLNQRAPLTQFTRLQLMANAHQTLDAPTFVEIIKTWRKETGKVKEPPQQPAATPKRAANPPVKDEGVPKIISRDEFVALGERARLLNKRGDRQQAAEIMKKLDAAVRENRVR